MSRTRICLFDPQEFGDRSEMANYVRRARHPMPNQFSPRTDSIRQSCRTIPLACAYRWPLGPNAIATVYHGSVEVG